MAINPPTTTLNFGFVITDKKQIKALYDALTTWRNTIDSSSAESSSVTKPKVVNGDNDEETWTDAKGSTIYLTQKEAGYDGEYSLVEYFLHKSGYGDDIAQVHVKKWDESAGYMWDDRDSDSDSEGEGEGKGKGKEGKGEEEEEESKSIKGIAIVYFPKDHSKNLVQEYEVDEFCNYMGIEFACLDVEYMKKAIGRLEEFLNDPVIKAAKLDVKFGVASSMSVTIGQ
ncbi:hypothetical protein BDN72DRAFT_844830 [Pluteus cervinus]|uniref:Uncharacterized protein n=1 Tax=Pluteus cervinus TaxID=181527 RepID=A0ACD3AK97_9AGAR|nr:hypothetical protein BDN72DRAFT_844830 [Pluteus cervinus]